MDDDFFDYKSSVDKMMLVARVMAELPLDEITDAISRAHTLGPFIDPTKYRDALYSGDMDLIGKLAQSLKEPKTIMKELLEKYGQ